MSASREKLDAWHAQLDKRHAERMAARDRERQRRLASPAPPTTAEPTETSFDADHVTSRGIRSVWD